MKLRRDSPADDELFDESVDDESVDATFAELENDENARGGDIDVTRRRLENSRLRRAKQSRQFLQVFALCALLFVLAVRWWSPREPQLSVAWPSATLGSSRLPNGATISMRGGQPFTATIVDAALWNVRWNWSGGEGEGLPMRWSPSGNSDQLVLRCRAKPAGAQWLWSWLWPTRVLEVNGTSPVPLGNRRFVVVPQPGAPIRVSSRVVAQASTQVATEARWHENALPLLEIAARNTILKSGATWTIVPSADGRTPARDDSTYVALSDSSFQNPADALTQIARQIETLSPKTDIKWVARLAPTKDTPRAILWLDFEKRRKVGARGGWIVQSGNSVAQPTRWWKE